MSKDTISLTKAFGESLGKNALDAAIDYAEIGIDAFFEDGSILESIPIVKTIYALGKTALNIHDKYFFIRTIKFISRFNNGDVSQEELQKHRNKLGDERKLKKEYECVIQYLDLCTLDYQSILMADFYKAYLKEKISWEKFSELSEANRRMFLSDYPLLKHIVYLKKLKEISDDQEASINRMLGLGLLIDERSHSNHTLFAVADGDTNPEADGVILTKFGELFGSFLGATVGDASGI